MSEEKLDRFARGELSPAESRELSRKALDDPDLFEELTYTSIAKTALASRKPRKRVWPRLVAMAAAVAVGFLSLYALRQFRPAPAPVVAISGPPVFLAHSADSGASFRGAEPDSRAPRAVGSVTAIADGIATIDLGSLDGLAKDSELEVVREGETMGTIKLTTIFRERARGEVPAGLTVRLADQVRVPAHLYLRAVLDEIEALSARGDSDGAQRMAAQAAAIENLDIATQDYDDWNNLGGIAALRGDRGKAQQFYQQALRANPPQDARRAIETNLARVRVAK
jgi:tetratricopeptide (TPR) repeat protein